MSRVTKRLRALYDCPLLVLVFDSDGRIIACNQAAEQALGWTEAEVRGQYHPAVPSDTRVLLQPLLVQATHGGAIPDVSLDVRCKDGSTLAMDVLFFPIYNASNQVLGVAAIRVDQAELQQSERRVRNVLETMADAFYAVNRDWRFTYVNNAAGVILQREPEDLVGTRLWDEFPDAVKMMHYSVFHRVMVTQVQESFKEYAPRLDIWVDVRVYPSPSGLSVYFNDITARIRTETRARSYAEAVRQMPIGLFVWRAEQSTGPLDLRLVTTNPAAATMIGMPDTDLSGSTIHECLPKLARTKLSEAVREVALGGPACNLGEILYGDDLGGESTFSVRAFPLPEQCAGVTFEDISERKTLDEQVQLQARLLDAMGQAVIATTPDGIIIYLNEGAERLCGYSPGEAIGRSVLEVIQSQYSPEESRQSLDALRAGEVRETEDMILRRDGTVVAVRTHATPVRDEEGMVTAIIGVSVDVTAQRRAETELRASEERFRAMFDQAAVGVGQTDLDGQWRLVNDRLAQMYGYSREELLTTRFQDLTYPEDLAADLSQLTRVLNGEIESYCIEKRYVRKNRTVWWAQLTISVIRDSEGKPISTLALVEDIDIRKRAELALTVSEERYRSLVETSPDGIALVNATGSIVMTNQRLATMMGYESPDALQGTNIRQHITEDERGHAEHALVQRFSGVPARLATDTFTVMRRDGSTFPAEASSMVLPGEAGEPVITTSTIRDISERVAYEVQLQHLALHDSLSGLANRTLLDDRLRQAFAEARRTHGQLALLVLDLDRFKEINDTYGHHLGDDVLREVATRLKRGLREVDTLARLGCDEFAVVLPRSDLEGALQTTLRLGYVLEQLIDIGDLRLQVGASFGIALYSDAARDAGVLLRQADVAMYMAKSTHSGYAVYDVEKDSYNPTRLRLSSELRDAIQTGQLALQYQPKLELASGRIVGVEALVRWNHPTHGLLAPDQFIPLAEHSGLIRPLTAWVIENALRQCRQWRDMNFHVGVAVNVSARSLGDPDLRGVIDTCLASTEVPPGEFTVEITESVIMTDSERAMHVLTELADAGVRLAIDDFGTGYSSLAYLRYLPVHELKIDKSFVMDLDTNEDNRFIVRSVVDLGHNLGLAVVAEGIENQTTLDILATLGCNHAQGYHVSYPQSGSDITEWLQKRMDCGDQMYPPHIAIVDDDKVVLDALESVLTLEGYSVTALSDPTRIDSLALKQQPDLFLIDIMMAGTSGIEVAEQLRMRGYKGVPMLAMSASDRLLEIAMATKLFDAWIRKPYEITHLLSLVTRYGPRLVKRETS